MGGHDWVEEFDAAVTVCDADGVILEMNDRAARMFREQGGRALVGSNVLECHPEPARSKLRRMMEERRSNTYTIEKAGRRRLVHQAPWHRDGEYRGFVEIVLPLPGEVPHFVRDEGRAP
jgi:PAS domain S-box-containing protein